MPIYSLPQKVDSTIFRAYDIRGIADENLTAEVVYAIALAFATEAQKLAQKTVVVARDGRLSGPELIAALKQGLREGGCDVIDIGMVPTPVLYFATVQLGVNTGIMLTGSHNPGRYNGLKMVLAGETLSEESIQLIGRRVTQGDIEFAELGSESSYDVMSDYIQRIVNDVQLTRPLKIVVDAGNGIAGLIAPVLYQQLSCQVTALYCDVDGRFPNHHPDPSQTKNLQALQEKVLAEKADVGLAFDGDGDRLGIITNKGDIIWPDQQMMIFAADILTKLPGAEIILDVKCSKHLSTLIRSNGGQPLMWKTGHSFIKKKLKETGAPFAGEMSGHLFFKDRWYGFDDGLYAGARFLEILAKSSLTADEIYACLPKSISTPELTIAIPDAEKFSFMEKFVERSRFEQAEKITIDGLRVEYPDGWGLVRLSNTTPNLVLRFEADSMDTLGKIQEEFRHALQVINPELQIPF